MSIISGRFGSEDAERSEGETVGLSASGTRWLRRHLAGGVTAVTTVFEGRYRASTVTASTVVSIDPAQFLVSIELDSQMDRWLRVSGFFGLNVLPWDMQFLADQFAGFTPLASPRFDGIDHFVAISGAPLLSRAIAWADCRVVDQIETGDHRCFLGEAAALGQGAGNELDPLIYFRNGYRRLR